MKKRKIIGGVLTVLMLCGVLVGCSANSAQTAPYEKGTITETEFTSKWMGLKYTGRYGDDDGRISGVTGCIQ